MDALLPVMFPYGTEDMRHRTWLQPTTRANNADRGASVKEWQNLLSKRPHYT